MQLSKTILIPIIAIALLAGAIFGATVGVKSFAQTTDNPNTFPPVIQKLVDKFNLNTSDVQTTLDEVRTERQAEMEARYEEKLNEAVQNKDLTEEKKNLILNKHKELVTQMQLQKDELEKWANDNGVDLKYLGGFGFHGGRFGKGMHHGMGWGW